MTHDTHTAREKAEAYVRGKLPELVKNAHAQLKTWDGKTEHFVEYHPIQLQHWLRVLEQKVANNIAFIGDQISVYEEDKWEVVFNLTTGQPATEADYQAFNDIVGA